MLLASRTSTRSSTFAVTPADERFMVALTRLLAATRMACTRSKTLRTFKRFCFLCSTKFSRLAGCAASSSSGTREIKDVWGLRPNESSKTIFLDCSDESGKVRLTHHAGATYSSQRSGQALQSSANISWSHPTKSLDSALTARVVGGSEVESGVQLVAERFQSFWSKFPTAVATKVPRDPESQA